jgi:hypothetical protein
MNSDELAYEAEALAARIAPLFAGRPPEVVGAALADLMSTLLAGHQGPGAEDLRAELLARHIGIVLELVPINEAILRELRGDRQ